MIGNISTHAALVSLWPFIWGDNYIVRKKIIKCYAQKRHDCLSWQGAHRSPVLYFQNESNSVAYQILQVTLGLEEKPIKINIGQSYRSDNEHICRETASSGRKKGSFKVFSWPPCSLMLCSSTVTFIVLLNCSGNLMCSEVTETHLKSLQTVVGQDEAWFLGPLLKWLRAKFLFRKLGHVRVGWMLRQKMGWGRLYKWQGIFLSLHRPSEKLMLLVHS